MVRNSAIESLNGSIQQQQQQQQQQPLTASYARRGYIVSLELLP